MSTVDELTELVKGLEGWLKIHGKQKFIEQLPFILERPSVIEKKLVWRGKKYYLGGSPAALEIFQLFCNSPQYRLKKEELIKLLYGETAHFSAQMRRSIEHNVVKRLSRARLLVKQMLSDEVDQKSWFYFDQDEGYWYLIKNRLF